MAWRRDPATGEWEMIDPNVPDPMTQSTTGQEFDPSLRDPPTEGGFGPTGTEAGYTTGDAGVYPVMSPQMAPERTPEGAPIYARQKVPGGIRPEHLDRPDEAVGYDNVDYAAIDQWVQDVQARGNEIRKTGVGTFEVGEGNRILSKMPEAQYRTN